MGAAAFLPPIRSGDFLVADRGAGGTESPLYTFRPLHFPPTESPNNTKEQATRKSPGPVGDKKVAPPSRRQESRLSQEKWASRPSKKSPGPVGDKKVAPPSRQESRLSQWATRKSPLQAGAACPSGRQESRPSKQAARKPPVPVRKSPLQAGGKKAAWPSGRQESRPSKPPLQRQLFRDGEPTPDNRAAAVSHSRLRTTFSGTGTRSISTAGASSISRTGLSTSMAR